MYTSGLANLARLLIKKMPTKFRKVLNWTKIESTRDLQKTGHQSINSFFIFDHVKAKKRLLVDKVEYIVTKSSPIKKSQLGVRFCYLAIPKAGHRVSGWIKFIYSNASYAIVMHNLSSAISYSLIVSIFCNNYTIKQ